MKSANVSTSASVCRERQAEGTQHPESSGISGDDGVYDDVSRVE